MQLEHSFSVPVPVEVAWEVLRDPERVAPCFPGATLTSVEGDEFTGNVKVKMGPVSLLYKGTGRFSTVDEASRRLVLEATGKDSRGNGTASATVTATLAGEGDSTTIDVLTDLTITGRPAQLGRGLISEVGGKIVDAFAGCLAGQLGGSEAGGTGAPSTPPAPPTPPTPPTPVGVTGPAAAPSTSVGLSPEPERSSLDGPPPGPPRTASPPSSSAATVRPVGSADEIDLLNLAGQPVLKRLVPVAVGVLAVLLLLRWLRRRA